MRKSYPSDISHDQMEQLSYGDAYAHETMRCDSMNDKCLPSAAKFEPKRWLGGGKPGMQAHAAKCLSMPFGAAPRICPGRYLALLEMKTAMAMAALLGNFDIESVDTPDGHEAR